MNKRSRFEKWLYWFILSLLVAILLSAFAATAAIWVEIEEDSRKLAERMAEFPPVAVCDLPENFDEVAYQEALDRYYIEQGWVTPLGLIPCA